MTNEYLRPNSEIGKMPVPSIPRAGTLRSSKFFSGRVFNEVLRAGDGGMTLATNAIIQNLIRTGKLSEILRGFKPTQIEWEDQSQILLICEKYHEKLRHKDGLHRSPAILFPLKSGFVVDVRLDANENNDSAHVYRHSYNLNWYAEHKHRFIFPKRK